VRLGPSTPGDYVRARVLVPLKSGCDKTDPNRHWHGLSIPIQQQVKDLFAASLISHVGNGTNTLFWTDKWLNGCSIRELAPEVVSKVDKRALTTMSVAQAPVNRQWIANIKTLVTRFPDRWDRGTGTWYATKTKI
jgi:hypothetical protein